MIFWRNSFCSESETNYGTQDKVPPNVVAKRKVSFEIIGIYCISNVFFEVVWCVFWEYPIHIALLMVAVNRLFVSLLKSWTLYSTTTCKWHFEIHEKCSLHIQPNFLQIDQLGLVEISFTQNLLELSSSLGNCILAGPRCTWFFLELLLRSSLKR